MARGGSGNERSPGAVGNRPGREEKLDHLFLSMEDGGFVDKTHRERFAGCIRECAMAVLKRKKGLRNHADAEDLAQEVTIRVLRVDDFRTCRARDITAWTRGIVHNVYVDWVRKQKRTSMAPLVPAAREVPEARDSLETVEVDEYLRATLDAAKFTPRWREILRLQMDGQSASEIAEHMGTSPESIRVTLCKMRKRIAAIWFAAA